jgi:putative transposase
MVKSIGRCPHRPKAQLLKVLNQYLHLVINIFHHRQGQMDLNNVYFFTATIYDWKLLLEKDEFKLIVINSLRNLVERNLICIYGFTVMPNHIHLLWEMKQPNGKEMPGSSFLKFTAHEFKKRLQATDSSFLNEFTSQKNDRQYQFWKRDPLAIPISSETIFFQKLEYIHNNAVSGKWKLCSLPEEYRWSSARFYFDGTDEFGILTDIRDAEL